jgi:hypothetical protein
VQRRGKCQRTRLAFPRATLGRTRERESERERERREREEREMEREGVRERELYVEKW